MPPPAAPPQNDIDWEVAEDVLGLKLPDDFKGFVRAYGNSIWCDTFRPVYPENSRKGCEEYRTYLLELLEPMDYLYDDKQDLDFKRYPERGGLLPCLIDFGGKHVCWVAEGDANNWGT